jgi:hypothetical protein
VVAVSAAAGAAVLDRAPPSAARAQTGRRVVAMAAAIPALDTVSTSWYCAEGTVNGGRADEAVLVTNVGPRRIDAVVTAMTGPDDEPSTTRLTVERGVTERVELASITSAAEPGVVVEAIGGPAVVEHELRGSGVLAVLPCARHASTRWYFADGTSVKGARQRLVLFDPFGADAIVDVRFLTDTGSVEPDTMQALVVPRRSRISIAVDELLPRQQLVGIDVHARVGRVVAERSEAFDGTASTDAAPRKGLAVSLGATKPSRQWQLPLDVAAANVQYQVGVANFGRRATQVEVATTPLDGAPSVQRVSVPARGIVAVDAGAAVPPSTAYVVTVHTRTASGEGTAPPVVAEAMLSWLPGGGVTGVDTDVGPPLSARRWVVSTLLATGARDGAVTIVNLGTRTVRARVSTVGASGRAGRLLTERTIAPGSWASVTAGDESLGPLDAVMVTADRPVAVTRTIAGGSGTAASGAIPDLGPRG